MRIKYNIEGNQKEQNENWSEAVSRNSLVCMCVCVCGGVRQRKGHRQADGKKNR